jgi:hypothetical protein
MTSLRSTLLAMLLGLLLWAPAPASAAKDKCTKADAKLASSGIGDHDGDGLSDCREIRYLGTFAENPDSDDDGLDDGEEMEESCHPLDVDTDDDGIWDGDDDDPVVEQKVKAFLDAIACPQPGVPGSITALDTTAALNDQTEFDDASCEEIAARWVGGETLFVEIEILENMLGELTATEVELEHLDDDDSDSDSDSDSDD